MINKDHDLNSNHQNPANNGRTHDADGEMEQLFGSSIHRMVSQYQAALKSGLDKEIEKVVNDFQSASVGSNEAVAKRMRSRIEELVSEEVRRVFDSTLHSVERSFTDPIRARAAEFSGPGDLNRETSKRPQAKPRSNSSGGAEQRPQSATNESYQSPFSGSVPEGYPQRRQAPANPDSQGDAPMWSSGDQEAPMTESNRSQTFGPYESAPRESTETEHTSPVSPASWVLPGGTASRKDSRKFEHQHDDTRSEIPQQSFGSREVYFEPDDEVDPFVASLDDDLAPESDYYPDAGYEQEESTSDLPNDALTAVMSENTDLTTIAHDSREIVHVPSYLQQSVGEDESSLSAASEDMTIHSDDDFNDADEALDVDYSVVEPLAEIAEPLDVPGETAYDHAEPAIEDDISIESESDSALTTEEPFAALAGVQDAPTVEHADEDSPQSEKDPEVAIDAPAVAELDVNDVQSDIQSVAEATAIEAATEDDLEPEGEQESVAEVAAPIMDVADAAEPTQSVGIDASEAKPVNALPGSVEIDNEQAEGAEIPESTEFEGTVRLNVEAHGCIKEIVHFVRELRQKPELRLLRLVGNNKEGVDIWLGLREPLRIKSMLPEIEGVNITVRPLPHIGGQDEKLLGVRMTRMMVAETVSEVS